MNKLNRYLCAVFLMLTFAQGIGMRLWMHHWFHESKSTQISASLCVGDLQLKCDCLLDAGMPLEESNSFHVSVQAPFHYPEYFSSDVIVSSLDKRFCSLKGPPRNV